MAYTRTKVDALKDLGKKVTGKDIDIEENETVVGILDKITKDYSGGGSGGTSDYTELDNKPQINGVTLSGNKTSEDLGITSGGTTVISLLTVPQNPDESEEITNATDLATLEALNTAVETDISNLPTFIKIGDNHICNLTEAIILNGSIRRLRVHYNAFENTMVDYERIVEGDTVTWNYFEVTF